MRSSDIILGILLEKPATGYEIKEKFTTSLSNFYNASFGSIYPILHKLTKEEKVVFETITQSGKPNKKVYSITQKGKIAFQQYLRQPVEDKKTKWDFMAHLFYSKYLTIEERLELIDSEIATQKSEVQILTALREKLAVQKIDRYQFFCLDLGIKQKQLVVTELQGLKDNIIAEKQ
ncbi:PadR family transcriptional regulator [Ligilactobacillus sp. WILCCON 0076]|uniref:PadR family transcriptional regulator n=1 Tax=Ligilactobacillus ubinensis TaxID=2876789 RepID=A0A9X2FMI8_9LACO|nr:PadR family transcriptional regulator [Ligilactobacillus ubinensis]MCP0887960.1 PadR family transcriptional regulator [Ligilactobacillus ubinensis]